MELAHGSFTSDNAWDVEGEFLDALFQVNENYIWQDLEAIPPAVDDNLWAVPQLTWMSHSRLRQFVFVNFRLEPVLFLCKITR